MNKQELIDFVADKASLTKKDATQAIDAVFEGIITGLKTSKDARFVGFGSFNLQASLARKGRNPRTAGLRSIFRQAIASPLKLVKNLRQRLIKKRYF